MSRKRRENEAFVMEIQRRLGLKADGWAGEKTRTAFRNSYILTLPAESSSWPAADERSLRQVFGEPGENNLTRITLPYEMELAWERARRIQSTRCHRKVASSLVGILEAIRDHYGDRESLERARMHLFGGVYNFRRQRGGRTLSTHSWGIAIDLDPLKNGFRVPWPETATMPAEVIRIFEAEGWKSGARAWGRDAMHFQATK